MENHSRLFQQSRGYVQATTAAYQQHERDQTSGFGGTVLAAPQSSPPDDYADNTITAGSSSGNCNGSKKRAHKPDASVAASASEGVYCPSPQEGGGAMDLVQLRARARKHVNEAIKMIPMERKAAYLEASEKAPYLFESESDPLLFLRRCSYNIWDASTRLCLYWEQRLQIFGPDRAFLPLTLTGDGALDKNDILSLQAGFPAILPPSASTGMQVAYCDRRQNVPSLTAEHRLRGVFYVLKVLAEDDRAQTEGVLVFVLLVTPRRIQDVDYNFVHRAFGIGLHASPIKMKVHLLNCLPKGSDRKLYPVQDLVSAYLRQCISTGLNDLEVHFEREHNQLLELLQGEFGLTREGIPTELGGSWTFMEATSWCRKRALMERQQFKSLLVAAKKRFPGARIKATPANKSSCSRKRKTPSSSDSRGTSVDAVASQAEDDQATKLSKIRAANVIHSRRKRERKRQELVNLTHERDELQKEQIFLKTENARLQELWKQAQQLLLADE